MATIIDRRLTEKGKSLVSRQKYIKRIKDQVKDSVKNIINKSNVKDLVKAKTVAVPGKGLRQPTFQHGKGGINRHIVTGNKEYEAGSKIPKPQKGNGKDPKASDSGEGIDEFEFLLSKEEFLELLFEDMELPNLIKKSLIEIKANKPERAGYSIDGSPNRLNILQSMKISKGRHFALETPIKKKIKELENKLINDLTNKEIIEEIERLKKKLKRVPFLEDSDLRYNNWEIRPKPITSAKAVYIMDTSGSMGEKEKELAKRYFLLHLLFLMTNYEQVETIFIAHTQDAREVSEDEFFYGQNTGGTVVSSGLILAKEIISQRCNPAINNVYISQISDGDNFPSDDAKVEAILDNDLLPITQYYTYIEIDNKNSGEVSGLMSIFNSLETSRKNLKSKIVKDVKDIYPVFKELFEKKHK